MQKKSLSAGLIIVALLITSIILFIVSIGISKYNVDVREILINKLKKEKVHNIQIVKTNTHDLANNVFEDDDIEYIKDKVSSRITEIFNIKEYNENLNIVLNQQTTNNIYYVNNLNSKFEIIDDWSKLKIIGREPTKKHEVVIAKYIADQIIKNGVYLQPTEGSEPTELYEPSSYKELIESNKKIYFNCGVSQGSYIIITGILDEDIARYNVFKFISLSSSENILFKNRFYEFKNDSNLDKIYVNNSFLESLQLEENNRLSSVYTQISHKVSDKYIHTQGFYAYLKEPVEYFDGKKITTIDHLNKNEVIISMPYLKAYTNTTTYDDYESAIKKECNDELNLNECIYKFLNDNNIIGSTVDIEILDISGKVTGTKKNEYKNLKIIGYETNAYHELYSKELLEPYIRGNKEIIALKIYETDYKKLEKIIREFEIESSYIEEDNSIKYKIETPYNTYALLRKENMKKISKVLKITSITTLIISILLLIIKYVIFTMRNRKKKKYEM